MPRPRMRTLVKDKEHRDWAIWLEEHYCKHGHPYLIHFGCYEAEHPEGPIKERVGYLDIESSNLKADYGIVFCYCIKDSNSKKIYETCLTANQLRKYEDWWVVKCCIRDMKLFDRIVTWYGSDYRFDVPFLRTRALDLGLVDEFPAHKQIWQTDGYSIAKKKFCFSSNRLVNVTKVALKESRKTRIERKYWIPAMRGNKDALAYILQHCRNDVLDLEGVFNKISRFAPKSKTSI